MNEIVKHTQPMSGADALTPQNMDQAVTFAKAMASAKMVPQHLQGDVGSCLMVVEQAMRWKMSPFAVAQCTSNIRGKLLFEGKLVAAACESVGAIEGYFDYHFEGTGDNRTVTVSAIRRGETEPRTISIRLADVKTDNEMWRKQPDQQLVYSGTRNWARRWAPSVMLGTYAPEEFSSRTPDAAVEQHAGLTIDAEIDAALAARPTPEKPRRTYRELLTSIARAAADAPSEEEIVALGESPDVRLLYEHANKGLQDELSALLAAAMARVRGEADNGTTADAGSTSTVAAGQAG